MKSSIYKITGWLLMAIGVIYASVQIGLFYRDFADFNFVFFTALLILALTILPGRRFIHVGDNKRAQNKLNLISLVMAVVSSLGFIYSAGYILISCIWNIKLPFGLSCAGDWGGVGEQIFGVYPSVALYILSLLLMLAASISLKVKKQ